MVRGDKMADKNWQRGRGEASHLSNLRIETEFLDSDYEIVDEALTRSDTRHLKVFSLNPKTPGKSSFHARVDDGTPKRPKDPELDIDIKEVFADAVNDFKSNRNGYLGHHSDGSPNANERLFEVHIVVPTGDVFKGKVSFNSTFSVACLIGVQATVSVEDTVVRAAPKT